jgi:hypothetical protein
MQAQQQPAVVPLVVPGPFALTPAEAHKNVVDLSTLTDLKLYKQPDSDTFANPIQWFGGQANGFSVISG